MKALSTAFCAICATFGLAISATAGTVSIPWDASADPLPTTLGDAETGLLEFTYVDGLVKTLTATPVDGGTIVLTGDTMEITSDTSFYMAAGGELVFSNAVHGSWNLNVYSSVEEGRTLSYSGGSIGTQYVTLFANQNLEDWVPFKTGNYGSKGWWSNDKSDNILVYNIRREVDGTITAQRQGKIDTHLIGVVKFQLMQSGSDIVGRCIYAGYWNDTLGIGKLGDDADAVIANPVTYGKFTNQGVTEPNASTGYGINKITLSRVGGLPTVRFAGGLNLGGVLYARQYAHVIYERAVTGSIGYGYQADANGILTFRDPTYRFDPSANASGGKLGAHGIKGSGTVEFEATDALYGDEAYETITVSSYSGYITSDWVTVAENQSLSGFLGATALFNGSMNAAYKDKEVPLQVTNHLANGQITGQFQHLFGWTNGKTDRCGGVLVTLRQNGTDVQMQATAARAYFGDVDTAVSLYGTDISNQGVGQYSVYDGSNGTYGIHKVVLQFKGRPIKEAKVSQEPSFRPMVGTTAKPGGKVELIIRGTDSTIMRYAPSATYPKVVLPCTNGLLRVQNGGYVVLNKNGASQEPRWGDDMALIQIERGGVFSQQNNWGVGWTQRVDVVGGEYRAYDLSSINDGQSIFNFGTFSGGNGVYSGRGKATDCLRAGYNKDSVWTVRGTSASSCDIALSLWAYASTGNSMIFAVNDVVEGSDFLMNGTLDVHATYTNMTVYKTGPGTMQLNDSVNLRGRPLLLKNGTWLVNGSSLTRASDPYTIDGGTLAVADGTANSLGVLTVGAAGGGITLGEGATLTFADSSGAAWTGAATDRVVITGFAEKSIRFGTTKDGLTTEQRVRLRTSDNKRLWLDAEGYLTTIGPASRLVIR